MVSDVLAARHVPRVLASRIYNFFSYVATKNIREDEDALLQVRRVGWGGSRTFRTMRMPGGRPTAGEGGGGGGVYRV